jgi:hypothetical protein
MITTQGSAIITRRTSSGESSFAVLVEQRDQPLVARCLGPELGHRLAFDRLGLGQLARHAVRPHHGLLDLAGADPLQEGRVLDGRALGGPDARLDQPEHAEQREQDEPGPGRS